MPNDFYWFLLHKVIKLGAYKVDNNELDPKGGSYKRLLAFVCNRANFKKAIMTIPYNSASASQYKYLVEDLYACDNKKQDKIMWYSG